MNDITQTYEALGVEPDFTSVDTVFDQVGIGITAGFILMEQDEE